MATHGCTGVPCAICQRDQYDKMLAKMGAFPIWSQSAPTLQTYEKIRGRQWFTEEDAAFLRSCNIKVEP